MPQQKKKLRIRYDRIAGVAIVFVILIILLVSCVKSCGDDQKPKSGGNQKPLSTTAPIPGSDSGSTTGDSTSSTTADGAAAMTGYTKQAVSNDDIHKGNLIVIGRDHPYIFPAETPNLKPIFESKLSTYQVKDWETYLDSTALSSFNGLMQGFYDKTHNIDIMIINAYRSKETQQNSFDAKKTDIPAGCSDYHAGLTIDLGIFPKGKSSGYYAPKGDYAWISENMAAYGYVLRYPEGKEEVTGEKAKAYQFRYVGVPHAAYMADNALCLEEYIALLKKDYSFGKKTLSMQVGDSRYEVYYIPASAGAETELYVQAGSECTISGDNMEGFIVTAKLS